MAGGPLFTLDEDAILRANPYATTGELRDLLPGRDPHVSLHHRRSLAMREGWRAGSSYRPVDHTPRPAPEVGEQGLSALEASVLAAVRDKSHSLTDLCNQLDRGPQAISEAVTSLQEQDYRVELSLERVKAVESRPGGYTPIPLKHFYDGRWVRFGVISDTHLCNKSERLDTNNAAYDFFAKEGIREVLHAGNYIDGYKEHLNGNELLGPPTLEWQLDYFLEHYPKRKDITTRFIDGDDHEGWFAKDIGLNVGAYLQRKAHDVGRTDLEYLGYMEVDLPFRAPKGKRDCIIRLFHAGGGSSYAVSYKAQKIVESYAEGNKPDVLLIGHYHKFDVCAPRGVICIQCGTTADQSLFMRKNTLRADMGFGVIEMLIDTDGSLKRFRHEWNRIYSEGYYRNRYDVNGTGTRVA